MYSGFCEGVCYSYHYRCVFAWFVIWFVVLSWVQHRRGTVGSDFEVVVSEDLESKYSAVLERELKEFEE